MRLKLSLICFFPSPRTRFPPVHSCSTRAVTDVVNVAIVWVLSGGAGVPCCFGHGGFKDSPVQTNREPSDPGVHADAARGLPPRLRRESAGLHGTRAGLDVVVDSEPGGRVGVLAVRLDFVGAWC